jgi:tetraacyldisaccharide 4'-kinase
VGDEPSVLAASLPGVPVIVGKNRRITGRRAIEEFGADVLVLDDGFQYWRLHKDREIVLLDALQPAARDRLLPRGIFREPWSHLRRAHEVWITHAQLADPQRVAQLVKQITRYAPHAAVRYTEHHPTHLRSLTGETAPLESLRDQQVLALSGLGNPRQFEMMLEQLGISVTPCRFPDHHLYTSEDIAAITAQLAPGMPVVTTAKDAVRLPSSLPFPVWVVEVEMVDLPGNLPLY